MSVAQVVQNIFDQISDSMSELTLLVVVLAEKNSAVPAQLPNAASVAIGPAQNIAEIARAMTQEEYVDFPEICKELDSAAGKLDKAVENMVNAIKNLQTSNNRKDSWNLMTDSCRSMSSTVLNLLLLVYGAEIKKFQFTVDDLINKAGTINPGIDYNDDDNQSNLVQQLTDFQKSVPRFLDEIKKLALEQENPYIKAELGNAANGVEEAVKKVVKSANDTLDNPKNAAELGRALENLKNSLKNARDAGTSARPKLGPDQDGDNLDELIRKALDALKKTRMNPKNDNANKDLNDLLKDLIANLRKTPPYTEKDADKIQKDSDDFNKKLNNLRKLGDGPNSAGPKKEFEDSANALRDALANLRRSPDGNSKKGGSSPGHEEFQKVLQNLRKIGIPTGNSPNSNKGESPDVAEQRAREQLKDSLKNLGKSIENKDKNKAVPQIKQAVDNARELAGILRDNAKNSAPTDAKRKLDAADNIDKIIPNFAKAGKAATDKNLADPTENKRLVNAARALGNAGNKSKPKDEQAIRDNWAAIKNAIAKNKAGQGAKPGGTPADLKNIGDSLARLRGAADRRKMQLPDPSAADKPSDELQKLWDRILNKNNNNNGPIADPENLIPKMEVEFQKLDNLTKASAIAPIVDVEEALEEFADVVTSGQADKVKPAAQNLLGAVDVLQKQPGENTKKVAGNLMNTTKELLEKAREVLADPTNENLADDVYDIVDLAKPALAKLKWELDPNARDREADVAMANVKQALASLRKAERGNKGNLAGEKQNVETAAEDLQKVLANLRSVAAKANPNKAPLLKNPFEEFQRVRENLRPVGGSNPAATAENSKKLQNAVSDILDTLRSSPADDAIKGSAKANNILAALGNVDGEEDQFLGDLVGTAQDLCDHFSGLLGVLPPQQQSQEQSPLSFAVLDLKDLIAKIESGQGDEKTTAALANASSVVNKAPSSSNSSSSSAPAPVPLSKAKTFEDVTAAVASQVKEKSVKLSKEAEGVAAELSKLAEAARTGQRQQMILSAKTGSAFILAFAKQLTDLSAKIPGNSQQQHRQKDNLLRTAQALKNTATQLKILTSVKAASISDSRDTDESLTTITRNLGDLMNQGLTIMDVVRQTTKL